MKKHNINYFNFLQLRFIEIGKNLCNIIIYLTLNTIEQIKMSTIIQSSTKSSSWARKKTIKAVATPNTTNWGYDEMRLILKTQV